MGAQLWYHEAPWHPDAAEALKALQARFLAENYDLNEFLPQHLASERESVAATKAEGDPYGLLEMCEAQIRLLENLCEQPIPDSSEARIEIIRLIASGSGVEIGNVLDLTGVADQRAVYKAQRLSDQETARLVGAAQPKLEEARQAISDINDELGRGECVCFPIFDAGVPTAWYFVGNTVD